MNPGPSVGVGYLAGSPGLHPLGNLRLFPSRRDSRYWRISFSAFRWSAGPVASVRPITQTRLYFDLISLAPWGRPPFGLPRFQLITKLPARRPSSRTPGMSITFVYGSTSSKL